ncbi:MFS transporter [Streptomyces boninensis]|uniref:MFS transporter n=1 Tax=Streptomyces boninensis TaxID=2039455 RepID=UPI003B21AAC0
MTAKLAAARQARREAPGFNRKLIPPMILGSILNPINSSMLAVALIPIGRAFDAPPSQTIWLVSGLYVATAVGQPVIGRLVDMYGPKLLYLSGTALVGLAGLLGVLAPTLGVLVLSRVLLGFGTSAAYPASMYLLRSEQERTGMKSPSGILAALSISNQVISVIGPTLGGLLIGAGGWHLIFAVNVPLSLACLLLGWLWLPRRRDLAAQPAKAQGVDLPGMVLFAAMLTSLMLFLVEPRASDWYLLPVAAAAGTAFAIRELRAQDPFIDLRILRGNAPLLATYARQLLAYTASYSFLYGFSQWLQEGRSLSASTAGLLLLPMSLAAIAVTAATGRRPQIRGKLVVGAFVQLAAGAAFLALGGGSPLLLLALLGVAVGIPQGLIGLANQNALYAQATPERMGSSAGLLRTSTYLGALVASAANAAAFQDGATTAGVHQLGWMLLAVGAVLTAATLADRSLGRVGRTA